MTLGLHTREPLLAYASTFAYDYLHLDADGKLTRLPEQAVGVFGEKLRKQREQRGIELDAISNTTKISTRMLRALEEEHFDQLPGGVFNKGFVRAYARQVGLDAEEAVSDYLAALRESQVQSQNILPDFRTPAHKPDNVAAVQTAQPVRSKQDRSKGDTGSREDETLAADRRKQDRRDQHRIASNRSEKEKKDPRPARFSSPVFAISTPAEVQAASPDKLANVPWGKLAAALLLISAVLAFWNLRRESHGTNASPPAPTTSGQASTTLTAPQPSLTSQHAGGSSKAAQTNAPPAAKTSEAKIVQAKPPETKVTEKTLAETTPGPSQPGKAEHAAATRLDANSVAASPAATHTSTTPPKAAEPASAKSVPAATTPGSGTNSSPTKTAARSAAVKPPSTFTLLVRAEKTTWVSITADGKAVAQENLIAPAQTSVRATREVVVRTGNAGAISFFLNGKEIPAQGVDGEVRLYIFDAQGIKASVAQGLNSTH